MNTRKEEGRKRNVRDLRGAQTEDDRKDQNLSERVRECEGGQRDDSTTESAKRGCVGVASIRHPARQGAAAG
jgi:hypothetical protein